MRKETISLHHSGSSKPCWQVSQIHFSFFYCVFSCICLGTGLVQVHDEISAQKTSKNTELSSGKITHHAISPIADTNSRDCRGGRSFMVPHCLSKDNLGVAVIPLFQYFVPLPKSKTCVCMCVCVRVCVWCQYYCKVLCTPTLCGRLDAVKILLLLLLQLMLIYYRIYYIYYLFIFASTAHPSLL